MQVHNANRNSKAPLQIMQNCWNRDPKARPSFEALCNDFKDFDSSEAYSQAYSRGPEDDGSNRRSRGRRPQG